MIERKPLLAALASVCSLVERRNTVPVLANLLLVADGDALTFTAATFEVWASVTLDAPGVGVWSTTAPATSILEAVKGAPGEVTFAVDTAEGPSGPVPIFLHVLSGRNDIRLPVISAADFPRSPSPTGGVQAMVEAEAFATSAKAVAPFMGKDKGRPSLMVGCLDIDPLGARLTATDGAKACSRSVDATGSDEAQRAILPRKLVEWLGAKGPRDGLGVWTLGKRSASYEVGAYRMACRLLDLPFPDVSHLTVADDVPGVVVSSRDLKGALELVMSVSDHTRGKTQVWVTLGPDGLRLACITYHADGETTIPATIQPGAAILVPINGGQLLGALRAFDRDEPVRVAVSARIMLVRSVALAEREAVVALNETTPQGLAQLAKLTPPERIVPLRRIPAHLAGASLLVIARAA